MVSERISCRLCEKFYILRDSAIVFNPRNRTPDEGAVYSRDFFTYGDEDTDNRSEYICNECWEDLRDSTYTLIVGNGHSEMTIRFNRGIAYPVGSLIETDAPYKRIMTEDLDEISEWTRLLIDDDPRFRKIHQVADVGLPYVFGYSADTYVCFYVKKPDVDLWKEWLGDE